MRIVPDDSSVERVATPESSRLKVKVESIYFSINEHDLKTPDTNYEHRSLYGLKVMNSTPSYT